jgi:hypothetical protein
MKKNKLERSKLPLQFEITLFYGTVPFSAFATYFLKSNSDNLWQSSLDEVIHV